MTAKNQKAPDTVKTLIRPRNPLQIFFAFLLVIGLPTMLYCYYYNYSPFPSKKVAGVPNNHLVQLKNPMDLSSLLLDFGSQLKFNTVAESMTVYFDYYQKGEIKEHKIVASLTTEPRSDYNGYLNIGITKSDSLLFVDLFSNGSSSNTMTDLSKFHYTSLGEDSLSPTGASTSIPNNELNIEKKQEIPLLYIAKGGDVKLYAEMENNLSEENLKSVENFYYVYLIVE